MALFIFCIFFFSLFFIFSPHFLIFFLWPTGSFFFFFVFFLFFSPHVYVFFSLSKVTRIIGVPLVAKEGSFVYIYIYIYFALQLFFSISTYTIIYNSAIYNGSNNM